MAATILLVEDEPAIQELLAFNLAQSGYRAIQALDAASAMAHINRELPDLTRQPRPHDGGGAT